MSLEVMPDDWRDKSVVRNFADPLSVDALAEEYKSWIDLGPIDFDTDSAVSHCIKWPYEEPDFSKYRYPGLISAHRLFMSGCKRIAGESMFERSIVWFDFRSSSVAKGAMQIESAPHIDALLETGKKPEDEQLRIIGFACNALPTVLLQGKLKPRELENGYLINVHNMAKRFVPEEIPLSRLILATPALPHQGKRATEATENRIFMRWHFRA